MPDFVEYFPLYHPKELLLTAVFDGTYVTSDIAFVGGYVLVLLVLVAAIFGLTMRTSGGWSA